MAKEYKTCIYNDTYGGRKKMMEEIDVLAKEGWELKSKEVTQQGWDFGKTCCLGAIFLPLALLGKKENVIQVIFEREVKEIKARKQQTKTEEDQTPTNDVKSLQVMPSDIETMQDNKSAVCNWGFYSLYPSAFKL